MQTVNPTPAPSPWLQWAKYYAAQGFRVLPLRPEGKEPLTARGFHDASVEPAQLEQWAAAHPNANLGVVPPEGIAIVDVDPRNGGTLEGLTGTRVQSTGGGGVHALYSVPPGFEWPSKLRPGVDIRAANRGYIVAAPSVVRQPDGSLGAYEWQNSEAPIAPAPHCVVALGRLPVAAQPRVRIQHEIPDEAIDQVVAALEPLAVPGQRHELAKRLGSWLSGRGWSQAAIEAVCAQLPFEDPNARTAAAVDCMALPGGATWLREQLGTAFDALDLAVPNPAFEAERARVADCAAIVDRAAAAAGLNLEPKPVPANDVSPAPVPDDPWCGLGAPMASAGSEHKLESLIEGLDIFRGYSTLIAGKANTSKSPTALSMALALSAGVPWLGRRTVRSRVLYLAWEKPRNANRKRGALARAMGIDPEGVHLIDLQSRPLNTVEFGQSKPTEVPGQIAALVQKLSQTGDPVVVFVDTYGAAAVGLTDVAVAEPLKQLGSAVTRLGAAFVPLLHTNKATKSDRPSLQDISGTGQLGAAVEAAIGLWKPDPENPFAIELCSLRSVDEDAASIRFRWSNVERNGDLKWGLEPRLEINADEAAETERRSTEEQQIEHAAMRIKTMLVGGHFPSEGLTQSEIQARIQMSGHGKAYKIVGAALRQLVQGEREGLQTFTGPNQSKMYAPALRESLPVPMARPVAAPDAAPAPAPAPAPAGFGAAPGAYVPAYVTPQGGPGAVAPVVLAPVASATPVMPAPSIQDRVWGAVAGRSKATLAELLTELGLKPGKKTRDEVAVALRSAGWVMTSDRRTWSRDVAA